MDAEPLAVGLKFGFLALLYLFLIWVARSALRELRRSSQPAPQEETGLHQAQGEGRGAATDAWLVVLRGGGLDVGDRLDLFGGLTIGRSPDADVRIEDRFASQIHARVFAKKSAYRLEDLGSTNGTFLNGEQVNGEVDLRDLDEIRIGDTEFRFELEIPA